MEHAVWNNCTLSDPFHICPYKMLFLDSRREDAWLQFNLPPNGSLYCAFVKLYTTNSMIQGGRLWLIAPQLDASPDNIVRHNDRGGNKYVYSM